MLLEEDYWYTALVACGTNTGKGLANLSCAFTYQDIRLTSGIVASDTAMGQHLDVHTCGCRRAKVEVTLLGCNLSLGITVCTRLHLNQIVLFTFTFSVCG